MSVKCSSWAWETRVGNHTDKLVLLALADSANDDGECWPSIGAIAGKVECSKDTIIRSISRMEAANLIEITPRVDASGRQTSNRYRLLVGVAGGSQNATVEGRNLQGGEGRNLQGVITLNLSEGTITPPTPRSSRVTAAKKPKTAATEKPAAATKPAAADSVLPDWLPRDAWDGFLAHRKAIKKPMTAKAIELAIGKLDQLRQAGNDPAAVLNQSVLSGWTGIFALKGDNSQKFAHDGYQKGTNSRTPSFQEKLNEIYRGYQSDADGNLFRSGGEPGAGPGYERDSTIIECDFERVD